MFHDADGTAAGSGAGLALQKRPELKRRDAEADRFVERKLFPDGLFFFPAKQKMVEKVGLGS